MGDRGNIVIKQHPHQREPQFIFLYTHSTGSALPGIVGRALQAARSRWNDEQYFSRIVFHTLLNGDTGEIGFGLSTYLCDNQHPLVVLDCDKQTVSLHRKEDAAKNFAPMPLMVWTFKEYVDAAKTDDILAAWQAAHDAGADDSEPFALPE